MTTLKIELDVSAQRVMHQVIMNNETIEAQIAKGIELALNDLIEGDGFVEKVRQATKNEIASITNKAVMSWEVQNKISKLITEKIGKRVEEYADGIAAKITESLNP